ncbi:unnamed protein product [Ophioblennius macclurei]
MHRAALLVPLLVLGWTGTCRGVPVLSEPLYPTQENFDMTRFMGTWHDIAVASSCPHMRRHASIGKKVLQKGSAEGKIKMTNTMLRNGTCMEITGEYDLTSTPGRIFYHNAKWQADVDAYVVHTNYNEYAIVIMSKQKASGQKSSSIILYSRTKTVRDTILDDFKTLVKQQGMSEDSIVTKLNRGDCVPGQQVAPPASPPQRVRRTLVLPALALPDEEGSGMEPVLFNATMACKAAPDVGPCFGMVQRFYYNSSSMSCEVFKYGGCQGNQNNFHDERECLQRCRTEAVCRLPMAAQPCNSQQNVWAFDSSAGLCVAYKPGFCQSNANKFYSKAECEEYCGVVKDEEELLKAN